MKTAGSVQMLGSLPPRPTDPHEERYAPMLPMRVLFTATIVLLLMPLTACTTAETERNLEVTALVDGYPAPVDPATAPRIRLFLMLMSPMSRADPLPSSLLATTAAL
jgi:hypothetical protein